MLLSDKSRMTNEKQQAYLNHTIEHHEELLLLMIKNRLCYAFANNKIKQTSVKLSAKTK